MRVLIVSTYEKAGGAAVAAKRLMEALQESGVKAKMLVREKETDDISVAHLPHTGFGQLHFLWERFVIYLASHFSREHLFEIDIANSGSDITRTPEFREADVIHLHWINQGMLSLGNIRKILASGKPVVWTMHDAWPATAVCHYTRGCNMFKSSCRSCQLLPGGGSPSDLASRVWAAKRRLLADSGIHFVACSRWLAASAKQSALLRDLNVSSIPNPIDTRLFHPENVEAARKAEGLPTEGRIILFVSQRVTDPRKGMDFFVKAIGHLVEQYPDMAARASIAILGDHAEEIAEQLPLKTFPLGYVSDEHRIRRIYNAADVYVLPSLEDNLPNTIMEAMACGVPCVGFKVGGIPEMIDHRANGYVATLRDAADLAEGIRYVLSADAPTYGAMSQTALRKVLTNYSNHRVAMKYIETYNQAIAYKHYRI